MCESITLVYKLLILFIIKSYTKYKIDKKIDRKTETENEKREQHMQPEYNQTHTLENRSTISSCVNQTGQVNDPSLSKSVVQTVTYYCHGMVREIHKIV